MIGNYIGNYIINIGKQRKWAVLSDKLDEDFSYSISNENDFERDSFIEK